MHREELSVGANINLNNEMKSVKGELRKDNLFILFIYGYKYAAEIRNSVEQFTKNGSYRLLAGSVCFIIVLYFAGRLFFTYVEALQSLAVYKQRNKDLNDLLVHDAAGGFLDDIDIIYANKQYVHNHYSSLIYFLESFSYLFL